MRLHPRDDKGRFVPLACPVCMCGTLRFESDGTGHHHWRCDGLLDPENEQAPLEACWFAHFDGEPYESVMDDAERYAVLGAA